MKHLPFILALLAAAPLLVSCEAAILGSAGTALHKKFSGDAARPSMEAQNYAAADEIATMARHKIDRFTPIQIGTFRNVGETPIDDKLGQAIADELGQRFMELGYTVGRTVQKEPGYLSRPNAVLKADYKVDRNNVNVDLTLVEEGSEKLLAKTNYDIPMKRNVRELGNLEDNSMDYLFNLDN